MRRCAAPQTAHSRRTQIASAARRRAREVGVVWRALRSAARLLARIDGCALALALDEARSSSESAAIASRAASQPDRFKKKKRQMARAPSALASSRVARRAGGSGREPVARVVLAERSVDRLAPRPLEAVDVGRERVAAPNDFARASSAESASSERAVAMRRSMRTTLIARRRHLSIDAVATRGDLTFWYGRRAQAARGARRRTAVARARRVCASAPGGVRQLAKLAPDT
jgi:hypothetical protein